MCVHIVAHVVMHIVHVAFSGACFRIDTVLLKGDLDNEFLGKSSSSTSSSSSVDRIWLQIGLGSQISTTLAGFIKLLLGQHRLDESLLRVGRLLCNIVLLLLLFCNTLLLIH